MGQTGCKRDSALRAPGAGCGTLHVHARAHTNERDHTAAAVAGCTCMALLSTPIIPLLFRSFATTNRDGPGHRLYGFPLSRS